MHGRLPGAMHHRYTSWETQRRKTGRLEHSKGAPDVHLGLRQSAVAAAGLAGWLARHD